MSATTEAVAHARSVVKGIALNNGVLTGVEKERVGPVYARAMDNVRGLATRFAKSLAHDLYSKPTHFVLECIQNADDNTYAPGVLPRLRIHLQPESIWIDCNETGFKEAHVKAICGAGESTKTGAVGCQDGYIGQKGIGFKSVFKVAQRVQIRSPPYSFDLDQTRDLGMVTPYWVSEDLHSSQSRDGYQTQITLSPSQNQSFWPLAPDVRAIEPTLLIFLRRLKSMEISTESSEGASSSNRSKKIFNTVWTSNGDSVTISVHDVLESLGSLKEHKFNLYRLMCHGLPEEPKRPKLKSSEVVLAFPVDENGQPVQETQFVHAFLPVRDFGFQFVIQADFILTASRQDLYEASPWNIHLRNSVADAFVDAMARFRVSQELKFTWIRFLPRHVSTVFWCELSSNIAQKLREQPILLSRDGRWTKPSSLQIINAPFLDRHGRPLIGSDSWYLSTHYAVEDHDLLKWLGVRSFSWENMIWNLSQASRTIPQKPFSWHEDIAVAISQAQGMDRVRLHVTLKSLPFIPLQSGEWAWPGSSSKDSIYFRGPPDMSEVPADIQLRLVDSRASGNKARRQLFYDLGVRNCETEIVANLIFLKHETSFAPALSDAVAHARFVFSNEYVRDGPRSRRLWLYDSCGLAAKGSNLYWSSDNSGPYDPAQLFEPQSQSSFQARFLHSLYHQGISKNIQSRWRSWLIGSLGVREIPKLKENGSISQDFAFIMMVWPDRVLEILRRHWSIYRSQRTPEIDRIISEHKVRCSDGKNFTQEPLGDAFAPQQELREIASQLCQPHPVQFLHLEPYFSTDWRFLEHFGVKFTRNLDFYLQLMTRRSFLEGCNFERAKTLYQRIGKLAQPMDHSKIRTIFEGGNYIYDQRFISMEACVWCAPKAFSSRSVLKPIYGDDTDAVKLFRTILGIKNAFPSLILDELRSRDLKCLDRNQAIRYYTYLTMALWDKSISMETLDIDSARLDVRTAFVENSILLISSDGKEMFVASKDCVWDSPIPLSSHHILKKIYGRNAVMSSFLQNVLDIRKATVNQVGAQFVKLKREGKCSLECAQTVLAYMLNATNLNTSWFEDWNMIYVPDLANGDARWRKPSECVWSAPSHLSHAVSLDIHYGQNQGATTFLRSRLGVPDAGIRHYIEELRRLSREEQAVPIDAERVHRLYQDIQRYAPQDQTHVREAFQNNPLIYHPTARSWKRLEDCVWNGVRALKSKFSLGSPYSRFEELFRSLGVQDASPEMLVKELAYVTQPGADDIEEQSKAVKDLLRALNGFTKSLNGLPEAVSQSLASRKVWPCLLKGVKTAKFVSCETAFFINDRRDIATLFGDRIPVLDMSVEEVGQLDRLLVELALDDRRLSTATKIETGSCGSRRLDEARTRRLKMKSEALLRCALHKKGQADAQEVDRLRRKLGSVTVFTVDSIDYSYAIHSQGQEVSMKDKGLIHARLEGDSPAIDLPADEDDAYMAQIDLVPGKLIAFLKITDADAQQTLSSALQLQNLKQIETLLDSRGIARAPGNLITTEDSDSEDEAPSDSFVATAPARSMAQPAVPIASASTPPSTSMAISSTPSTGHSTRSSDLAHPVFGSSRPDQVSGPPTHPQTPRHSPARDGPRGGLIPQNGTPRSSTGENNSFTQEQRVRSAPTSTSSPWALPSRHDIQETMGDLSLRRESIVASAQRYDLATVEMISASGASTVNFQPPTNFNFSDMRSALPDLSDRSSASYRTPRGSLRTFAPRTDRQRVRDFGVGYEGELFVVEVLERHLSNFSKEDNWTSKLRTWADVSEYRHSETTDITYDDAEGTMTALIYSSLSQSLGEASPGEEIPGWLQRAHDSLAGPWPTYYVEVKTTTDACETPFFISRNQYRTMERMSIPPDDALATPKEIYILARVFNSQPRTTGTGDAGTRLRIYVDPWSLRTSTLDFEPTGYSVVPRPASGGETIRTENAHWVV